MPTAPKPLTEEQHAFYEAAREAYSRGIVPRPELHRAYQAMCRSEAAEIPTRERQGGPRVTPEPALPGR